MKDGAKMSKGLELIMKLGASVMRAEGIIMIEALVAILRHSRISHQLLPKVKREVNRTLMNVCMAQKL